MGPTIILMGSTCYRSHTEVTTGTLLHLLAEHSTTADDVVRYLGELEGRAFLRRWDAERDQVAWDACADPMRMFKAIAQTARKDAIRVAAHAVARYHERVMRLLAEADPVTHPQARTVLAYIASNPLRDEIVGTANLAMQAAHGHVPDAAADFCHMLRVYVPLPPWGFAGLEGYSDNDLLRRMRKAPLREKPRQWCTSLMHRVETAGGITAKQRAALEGVMYKVVGWDWAA